MENDYQTARKEAQELYSTFDKVHCPALGNQPVYFTAEGFNHLIYKRAEKPRNEKVQRMRFDLLTKAKLLLETATTFQEYEEGFEYVIVERHGQKVRENALVRSWGFVAIIKKFRIKVIVEQIGNGKMKFCSVIPAWWTRQYRDIRVIGTAVKGGLLYEDETEELKNATIK